MVSPRFALLKKINCNRNVHLWLPVAAENDVWPNAFSTMVNIFPVRSQRLRLNLASSNALKLAFKLLLKITCANERPNTKNRKPQSESNWHEG